MWQLIRSRLSDDRGVTAIELLIVVLLMGVVGGAATTSLVRSMKVSATTQQRFDALADLQMSVDRMSGQLRAAAPLTTNGSTLLEATKDTVRFTVYRNAAATNFGQREMITYKFCPDQDRIHVVRQPYVASPPALNCATLTAPILITDVVNDNNVAAQYVFTPVVGPTNQVRDITIRVRRALPDGSDTIEVATKVRLRNVAR